MNKENESVIKCISHPNIDATYQFILKGKPEAKYLCIDCYDLFEDDKYKYSITEISKQNIENLKSKIKSLIEDNERKKRTIANIIDKRYEMFIRQINRASNALIDLIKSCADEYITKIKKFEESNYIANYECFISKSNELMDILNDKGDGFTDKHLIKRGMILNETKNLKKFIKEKFENDKEDITNFKLNEEQVSQVALKEMNKNSIMSIFEKEFEVVTDFMKGKPLNIELMEVSSEAISLVNNKNKNLNFYRLMNIPKNDIARIKDHLNYDISYDHLIKTCDIIIESQNSNFLNMLQYSPGFFYFDNASFTLEKSHYLLIIQIILKRAFGENFISFDPKSLKEGTAEGDVELIYANKTIKSFSFKKNYGKDIKSPKDAYSNNFFKVEGTFSSINKKINSSIYIFKDDFSLFYRNQNINSNESRFFFDKIEEGISIQPDVLTILIANLEQLNRYVSSRVSTIKTALINSGCSKLITNIPYTRRNRPQNITNYNNQKDLNLNDYTNGDIKLNYNDENILEHSEKETFNRIKNNTLNITQDLFINKRNPYKMVDNIKIKSLLNQSNNLDLKNEAQKKIFHNILKEIFPKKIEYITNIREGRLEGLFMIFNKNKLFEICESNSQKHLILAYEVTCAVKIRDNIQQKKFYLIQKGFRLVKPLNEFGKLYKLKNYFIDGDSNEIIDKEDIEFPQNLDDDIDNYLCKDYQNIINSTYISDGEDKFFIDKALNITYNNGFLEEEKKVVLSAVFEKLLIFTRNLKEKNLDISGDIKVSQIKEFYFDLNEVKDKINKYEKSRVESKSKNNLIEINPEKFEFENSERILGFELNLVDEVFKEHSKNSNELYNLEKIKSLFYDKGINNRIYKFDLVIQHEKQMKVTSIFFFADIPILEKNENLNPNSYKFKDTNEFNGSNINIYFLNPLENIEFFRYKRNGRKKNFVDYSPNYYSYKNLFPNYPEINEFKEKVRGEIFENLNDLEIITKIIKSDNPNKDYTSQFIYDLKENQFSKKEINLIKESRLDAIAQRFFVNKDKNFDLLNNSEYKIIKFKGDLKIIDINGHISKINLIQKEILEKLIIEKNKGIIHKIYFVEEGLLPIYNFECIDNTSVEIELYDNTIKEILFSNVIERVKMFQKKLFENEDDLKVFYVENLRFIMDNSDSMKDHLTEIRKKKLEGFFKEEYISMSQVDDPSLYEDSKIYEEIIKCSEESNKGESIYFFSDFNEVGSNPSQETAKSILIEKLKNKKQRLYLHSINSEPTEEFKDVAIQTGGWVHTEIQETFFK